MELRVSRRVAEETSRAASQQLEAKLEALQDAMTAQAQQASNGDSSPDHTLLASLSNFASLDLHHGISPQPPQISSWYSPLQTATAEVIQRAGRRIAAFVTSHHHSHRRRLTFREVKVSQSLAPKPS